MKNVTLAIVFWLLLPGVPANLLAQVPQQRLDAFRPGHPIEKIYIHLDRSSYLPGQTIWFKAYLVSDFEPDMISTSLMVELTNRDSVINRQFVPVFSGLARGQIELPDTVPGGRYVLRAYTQQQQQQPDYVFRKSITIYRPGMDIPSTTVSEASTVRLEFFPEGGNLVSGLSNSVAFKATDSRGLPVEVKGTVLTTTGQTITDFVSTHDGMGYFDLTVEEGTGYYASIKLGGLEKKFALPESTGKGIVFRIISNGPTKSYEILQKDDDARFQAASIVGQVQHHVVFSKQISSSGQDLTGIIPTTGMPSGIMQVTVFNTEGLPLAERLTFIDNGDFRISAEVKSDSIDFSKRGRNRISLQLAEAVAGSFSISITDADIESEPQNDHLVAHMLLGADIRGYIHHPAYYFSSGADSVQSALDLLLMTQGWRRFSWTKMPDAAGPAPANRGPGYLQLKGKVLLKDSRRPFGNKDLMAMIFSPGTSRKGVLLKTDEQGRFRADSIIFFGKSRLLFTDIKGKKSRDIDVQLDADSIVSSYQLPVFKSVTSDPLVVSAGERLKKYQANMDEIAKAEGLLLQGVTLRAKTRSPMQMLEERYVSPLFAGEANAALDLTGQDLTPYQNILDYLQLRVAGLQIAREPDGLGYTINYRQSALASSMGVMPVTIFLDEIPADADVLSSIPANQIALVKLFGSFVGAAGNAPGGVLAVYTKKGSDREGQALAGDLLVRNGYSPIREFYSPVYTDSKSDKADNRITLLWNPTLTADGSSVSLPIIFYNSDRTRRYHVVVEGMTIDGRFLSTEQFIEPRRAF